MTKPKITPVGTDRFNISHRGITAQIWRATNDRDRWHGHIEGRSTHTRSPLRGWTADCVGRITVEMMNEQADCNDALVAADAFMNVAGGRAIVTLGGQAALDAFEAALGMIRQHDADGLATVVGMMKAASRKRLALATAITTDRHRLVIVPGFSVAFDDGPTYFIGSRAEYDSYNLHYFGTITSITAKTVTVQPNGDRSAKRLKVAEFGRRNVKTPASKAAANAETMQCI